MKRVLAIILGGGAGSRLLTQLNSQSLNRHLSLTYPCPESRIRLDTEG